MQRSKTQVLYRYLPDAVFFHEDGYYAQVHHVNGERVADINRRVLLDELAAELANWQPDQVGIPNPHTNPDEFRILEPTDVSFDIFPLTFECTNAHCRKIRRWWQQKKVVDDTAGAGALQCVSCGSKMRQLRYLTAHNCGAMQPIHTPTCGACGNSDNVYLEDVGSFLSSSWQCRTCGWSQSVRFQPCNCGKYPSPNGQTWQQGFTGRDQRLWYPQTLSIVNLSGQTYDNLQIHPDRGVAAIASWLGDETNLAAALGQLDRPSGNRQTASEWAKTEAELRQKGVPEDFIATLKAAHGSPDTGAAAIQTGVSQPVIEMAAGRPWVERAGLFDRALVDDRRTFAEVRSTLTGAAATAAAHAANRLFALGIEDISVTQRFPIVVASYGYTRVTRTPGTADLRTYAKTNKYDGKTPIFAVPAKTEALIVTFSAEALIGFLDSQGLWTGAVPGDERSAKLALAELLAANPAVGGDDPAGLTRRIVHSASHVFLRALDDGQSGFGESSLAEWIVPDALTTAIYVASYNEFTLGAFDTVLRRRVAAWMENAAAAVQHCDNDPMCSQTSIQAPHSACDRCLHLSYGCRMWNADLDRKLLRRFWLWTQRQPVTP